MKNGVLRNFVFPGLELPLPGKRFGAGVQTGIGLTAAREGAKLGG
jgi:hypothetical protein